MTPFSENFDGTTSGTSSNPSTPDCWFFNRTQNGGTGYGYTQNSATYANSGTNLFYMYSSSNMTNDTMALISPEVVGMDTADKHITFWATGRYSSTSYTEEIAIATMSDPMDMTTLNFIDTVDITGANNYQYFDVYLDAANGYNGTDTYIAMVALGNYYFQIDDITIADIPNCSPSGNLSVANVTQTTADIMWTPGDGSSYQLEYGITGFIQGTGAPMVTGITDSSQTITGLVANTCFDVYVRDSCASAGLSPWFGPLTFCTPCDAQPTPIMENFANATPGSSVNPSEPDCWTFSKTDQAPGYGYTYQWGTPNSSPNHWIMSNSNSTSDTIALVSPDVQGLDSADKELSFYAYGFGTNPNLIIGTVSSPEDMSSFEAVDTVDITSSYAQYTVRFDTLTGAYNGTHKFIAIAHVGSSTYQTRYLDDISITRIPTCSAPFNLMASNITSSSADAEWTSLFGTNFKVEYDVTGFVQGTGLGNIVNNTTSPASMTGLSPNTYYDFYVTDKCDSTNWAGPLTFKTACTSTLNGTYTVGGTPGATNFATLDSALAVLNGCGVSGPVTLNLQGGTHTGPLVLMDITGTSATNTVSINGMGMNMDTIKSLGQTAGANINGSSYITISNLTIDNSSGSRGAWLYGNAHNITFDNCRIMANATSTSSIDGGVVVSGSSTTSYDYTAGVDNLTLTDCEITGGYFGVIVNGASTTSKAENITIEGCHLFDMYYYGIRLYYVEGAEVAGNMIDNFRNTTGYGIYMYYNDDFNAEANMVDAPYMGLYCYYSNYTSTPTSNSTIINNMLASSGTYGLYMGNAYYLDVYHNSVNTQNTYGCYGTGIWNNVNMVNNIFVGGTYSIYKSSLTSDSNVDLDYNLYNSNGTSLAYWSSIQSSLATWQTNYSSINQNSLEGDPVFFSATDLHIAGTLPNDTGDNSLNILEDIDGDTRPASGSTTVDIGADEYTPLQYDVSPESVVAPSNQECGDSTMDVRVTFKNFGLMSTNSVTATVNITGAITTSMTGSYTGSLASLGTDTITISSFNSVTGGTYNIEVILSMTGDQDASNDTLYESVTINDVLPRDPLATDDTLCAGDFTTLYYPPNTAGMTFNWLTATGDSIGTGDSLMVGPMGSNDTTFLLRAVSSAEYIGPADNTIGTGANYTAMNHYLEFTVTKATTIISVDVLSNGTGNVDVVFQTATGTPINTVTVPVTTAGWNTLVVNQSLPPGTYRMGGTTTNNAGGLYRNNSGASYPYTSTDGSVSITGNTFSASYYYFFYNWSVGSGGCPRPDGEITLYNGGVLNAAFIANLGTPTMVDLTVNFDASGSTGANTYTWDFGDGNQGTGMNPTHAYTSNGTYTVTLVVDGACGTDTLTQTVTIAGINIEESLLGQTLNIYPNPNDGQFRVEFQMEGLKDVKVRMVDAIGKEVYFNEPGKVSGMYKENIDISENADGLYILQIITEEATISRKITKH